VVWLDSRRAILPPSAQFPSPFPILSTSSGPKLFTLIALNCALHNGDAHLKNFGVVYDGVQGAARLAPVYDLVTTSV